jgi:hypothetical protein
LQKKGNYTYSESCSMLHFKSHGILTYIPKLQWRKDNVGTNTQTPVKPSGKG